MNPGSRINDPADDDPPRGPASARLNLQARWRLKRLVRADADLYIDVISLLGDEPVNTGDDPSFAPGAVLRERRWYRFGAEYRY